MPLTRIKKANLEICSFYHSREAKDYYHLANYSRDPVVLRDKLLKKDVTWPTTEHYFQAQKISDPKVREAFIKDMEKQTPDDCRMAMKQPSKYNPQFDDRIWAKMRDEVMLEALRAKYDQCAEVRAVIAATGDRPIVEDTGGAAYVDNHWGCGYKGDGDNMLGLLWMQVRAEKLQRIPPSASRAIADKLQEKVRPALLSLGNRAPTGGKKNGTLIEDLPNTLVEPVKAKRPS